MKQKVEDETIRRLFGFFRLHNQWSNLIKIGWEKHKADVLEPVLVIRQGEPLKFL